MLLGEDGLGEIGGSGCDDVEEHHAFLYPAVRVGRQIGPFSADRVIAFTERLQQEHSTFWICLRWL